jgi:tetratricopeptide (TPR) repeat protein
MKKMIALLLCWPLLLTGCRHTEPERPLDDELRRMLRNARTAFDRGQMDQAALMFERSLERARIIDRPREIGNAAYNLGLILISLGDYPTAELRLREAQAELARAQENLADVLLVRARLAQFQDDYSQVSHLADQVLSHPQSQPEPSHRVQALVLLGLARLHQGQLPEAERRLAEALDAMPPAPAIPLLALAATLEGKLLQHREQPLAAAQSFDKEADLWRAAQLYSDMAAALRRAGEAWLEAGDARNAGDRLFRAARSFAGQNLGERALEALRQAETAASLVEDKWLLQQIANLQGELRQDVEGMGAPGGPKLD